MNRAVLALALAVTAAGCSDQAPTAPTPEPAPPTAALQRFECMALVRERTVRCAGFDASGYRAEIFGGQNENVRLVSTNVAYDSVQRIFSADLTVRNLTSQVMGTTDDVTPDPAGIRVFFHSGPTVSQGTGSVSIANADGTATFTGADQPFFQYPGLLAPGQVTGAKRWEWTLDPTVTYFTFLLLVEAKLKPLVTISEIMAHPSTAGAAAGEWFEVYNGSFAPVSLEGWTIASGGDAPHVVTGPVVVPARGWAVLGASADSAANGGAPVAYAWSGVDLGDGTGDWLALRSPTGATVDSVSWGAAPGETASPPPAGASLALDSLGADNLHLGGASSRWRASPGFFGGGQAGSPGARNPGALAAVAISAADGSSCALTAAGQAWCWGTNSYGQLGIGVTGGMRAVPTPMVQPGLHFTSLGQTVSTTCMVETGGLYCTGAALPNSNTSRRNVPGLEVTGSFATMGNGVHNSLCAIHSNGHPWCWAWGEQGPGTTFEAVPHSVPFMPGVTQFLPDTTYVSSVSGRFHDCALTTTGEIWCRGDGTYGQTGQYHPGPFGWYILVGNPSGLPYTALATGETHTCALVATGQAYCWGNNSRGAVGIEHDVGCPVEWCPPGTVTSPQPVVQPAGVTFSTITAVGNHTCALGSDGRAWCWGANDQGQLGDGTTADRSLPAPVHAPANIRFSALSAGTDHTCAIVQGTGQPACWGGNASGGLGDGTQVRRLVPVTAGP